MFSWLCSHCVHLQVWPVIGCMGVGVAWLAFNVGRYLTVSPDTQWNKADRGSMWRTNFSEGKNWTAHRALFTKSRADVGHTSIVGMEAINRWVGGAVKEE